MLATLSFAVFLYVIVCQVSTNKESSFFMFVSLSFLLKTDKTGGSWVVLWKHPYQWTIHIDLGTS